MDDLFSFTTLKEFAELLSLIINLGMVLATFSMVYYTRKMLIEQSKAQVIIYPEQDKHTPNTFYLVTENIGNSTAYDIHFSSSANLYREAWGISPDSTQEPEAITDGPLATGIPYLPPRRKRVIYWGQYGGIKKSLNEKSATVTISFKQHPTGPILSTKNILDIKDFKTNVAKESLEHQQYKIFEKIEKNSSKLNLLLDRKLSSQHPLTTYMWAYIAWRSLKKKGLSAVELHMILKDTGLSDEQVRLAEEKADKLLRRYKIYFSDE